jgi:outer membrane protein TolC
LCIIKFCLVIGLLSGCRSTEEYKADADKEVYHIIDGKWQEEHGSKANYLVDDVTEDINKTDIDVIVPESGIINLVAAVAIATRNNRDYQTAKERLYIKALDLTAVRHDFAKQWFGTTDASYAREGGNAREGLDADESIDYDIKVGLDQLLADGALTSVSLAIDWWRFLTGDPDTSLTSVLSASVTQPLLRGSGREIVQENLNQAERDTLYQIRSFNRFRQEFVVSIITDYFRVLQSYDVVKNGESNYLRRIESKERLEMEAQAGRKKRFEVDQAQTDVLRAKNSYVGALQTYEQRLDRIKIRLALPTDANIILDQNELSVLEKMGVDEPNFSLASAVETGLLMRLDLANSRDSINDATRKINVAKDNLQAELNVSGGINVPSRGKTDFGTLQFHEKDVAIGLEADMPFDRKIERNNYRKALIALEQIKRQYDNDVDSVKLDVRGAYRQLIEAAEKYRIQKNSLDLAQQRVESTTMLLQAGRVTTRDLLDSQDALIEAENSLTGALIDHFVAKLNFYKDVGILNIKPDGMFELSQI